MRRLIWVFAGRKSLFEGFVVCWLISETPNGLRLAPIGMYVRCSGNTTEIWISSPLNVSTSTEWTLENDFNLIRTIFITVC